MDVTDQGRVAVPGGEVAYRIAGQRRAHAAHAPRRPRRALLLHLRSLADLAGDDLRVVFWDQLGCGESDQPDDPSLWRVDRFVDEVEAVRQGLGLGRVDVLGQSWGGMLAQEYALAHPDAVRTLILASTIASSAFHRQELARLVADLPDWAREPHRAGDGARATTTSRGTSRPWPRRTAATSAASRTRPTWSARSTAWRWRSTGRCGAPTSSSSPATCADWDVTDRISAITAFRRSSPSAATTS